MTVKDIKKSATIFIWISNAK